MRGTNIADARMRRILSIARDNHRELRELVRRGADGNELLKAIDAADMRVIKASNNRGFLPKEDVSC